MIIVDLKVFSQTSPFHIKACILARSLSDLGKSWFVTDCFSDIYHKHGL